MYNPAAWDLGKIGLLLDSGKQTDVIFMDMSKALDKVSYAILINKLGKYEIGGSLLKWFSSYLQGRKQRVTVLGASILGLILILLYANDLSDVVENSTVTCFADDTKVIHCIDSIRDTFLLQRDLDNLDNWSSTSGINFNELNASVCVLQERLSLPYTLIPSMARNLKQLQWRRIQVFGLLETLPGLGMY